LHKTTSNTATFRSEPDLLQATLHKSVQQWQVHYYSALLMAIERIHRDDTTRRRHRESYWIFELATLALSGINIDD